MMASESASTGPWAKESAARIVGTGVIGGGLAVATFFLSDAALPDDTQWWVHWAMAGASFVSYAIGVTAAVSLLRSKLEGRFSSLLEAKQAENDALRRENAELAARRDLSQARAYDADRMLKLSPGECAVLIAILESADGSAPLELTNDVLTLERSGIVYMAEEEEPTTGRYHFAVNRKLVPYFRRYRAQVGSVAAAGTNEALEAAADEIRQGIPGVAPLGRQRSA